MISTRPQSSANLPLFLETLPRKVKPQEIFKLTSLSNVIIKVEAYRFRWAGRNVIIASNLDTCRQIESNPQVVCGVEAAISKGTNREKENKESTPACCNYMLAEGEKPHTSNYSGCNLAREELQ
jgi:hypothetical protein